MAKTTSKAARSGMSGKPAKKAGAKAKAPADKAGKAGHWGLSVARAGETPKGFVPGSKTVDYETRVIADPDGSTATALGVPFDPKAVFGAARAPVSVTINEGYTYRTTTFTMCGERFVPLRLSHREAAGVEAGQTVRVRMALDEAERTVEVPKDLAAALKAGGAGVRAAFDAMSFTHRKEHVLAIEAAKKPETRTRRIAACVEAARGRVGR